MVGTMGTDRGSWTAHENNPGIFRTWLPIRPAFLPTDGRQQSNSGRRAGRRELGTEPTGAAMVGTRTGFDLGAVQSMAKKIGLRWGAGALEAMSRG